MIRTNYRNHYDWKRDKVEVKRVELWNKVKERSSGVIHSLPYSIHFLPNKNSYLEFLHSKEFLLLVIFHWKNNYFLLHVKMGFLGEPIGTKGFGVRPISDKKKIFKRLINLNWPAGFFEVPMSPYYDADCRKSDWWTFNDSATEQFSV